MTQSKTQSGRQGGSDGVAANGLARANSTGNGASAENGVHDEAALQDEVTQEAAASVDETDRIDATEGTQDTVAVPLAEEVPGPDAVDIDPAETEEWLESLRYVLESKGPQRAHLSAGEVERDGVSGGRRTSV